MIIQVPTHLPGWPEQAVHVELTMCIGPGDDAVVGWSIRSLTSMQPLSIGATPPVTRQDLDDRVTEVLQALGQAVATLLDDDPFP